MKPVFADTSFYTALLNPRDKYHEAALHSSEQRTRPVLLTEAIILELGSTFSGIGCRQQFVRFVERLRTNPRITVLPLFGWLVEAGFELFARRPDKEWSLTDCISFVVMERNGLEEALAADHHFQQAGFKALLL